MVTQLHISNNPTVIAYTTIVYQFLGGGKVLSIVSDGLISWKQVL